MDLDGAAVEWLLGSDEPAIRYLARRDLLSEPALDDRERILEGAAVRTLLSGQTADGGFGGHPYAKWAGAHWRLVTLTELAIPVGEPRSVAAAGTVLAWLTGKRHRSSVAVVDGRARRCASQEGNALAVCVRLGLTDDPRVRSLADALVDWQWPDGGWNCDPRPKAGHSSFHETLPPMLGLHEYATMTGEAAARDAAGRAAELIREHRLYRSRSTGGVIDPRWTVIHWPRYWHYDVLGALLALSRMGPLTDPRMAEALELLRSRRLANGRWAARDRWWRTEVVDWREGSLADRMVTLDALRVTRAAT